MKNKKLIVVTVSVIVVMIATGVAFATGTNSLGEAEKKPGTSITGNIIKQNVAGKSEGLSMQEIAADMGIDTMGMTNEQIKLAIIQKSKDIKAGSSELSVKKALTPEEKHENMMAICKEWGIDTTGMTDAQIEDAIRAEKLNRCK